MVSTRPPTSKSSSPFNKPLVTIPKVPITIGIIITFLFSNFFQSPSKVKVLIVFSSHFQLYSVINRDSKVHNFASSLFCCWLLWPNELSVHQWSGRPGFNPRSSHTKDLKNGTWCLLWLALSIIRYGSRVKWSNPGKVVAHFPTPRCSSDWKENLQVILD